MSHKSSARSWWPVTLLLWATAGFLALLTVVGVGGFLREDTYARCAQLFPQFIRFEDTSALTDARVTMWPLGLRCTFDPEGAESVVMNSGWFLTSLALVAIAVSVFSAAWSMRIATTVTRRFLAWIPIVFVLICAAYVYSSVSPALESDGEGIVVTSFILT